LERTPAAPPAEKVLVSLLHLHNIRAIGIDPEGEQRSDRVARAVALAWSATTDKGGAR
jgi:hypothetical protein